jgi:hypothetical protein
LQDPRACERSWCGGSPICWRCIVASGPVEYLVIKFAEVVAGEIIHVIDFIFIQKDQGGNLRVMELNEMDDEAASVFDPLVDDITRLL